MTIRLAVAGGNRGARFDQVLGGLEGQIELTAVCDPSDQVRAEWTEGRPELKAYSAFEDLVEDPEIDAVFIATPMLLHANQALTALNAGKHVLSEVIAATTLDECYALVETVEKTGLTYMMAENYCYRREAMMVRNMAEQGVFGELTYAEGAYIHDCRDLMFNSDLTRTWRGGGAVVGATGTGASQSSRGNGYPTHSLGPIAQWLGINRGDRLARTTTFVTGGRLAGLGQGLAQGLLVVLRATQLRGQPGDFLGEIRLRLLLKRQHLGEPRHLRLEFGNQGVAFGGDARELGVQLRPCLDDTLQLPVELGILLLEARILLVLAGEASGRLLDLFGEELQRLVALESIFPWCANSAFSTSSGSSTVIQFSPRLFLCSAIRRAISSSPASPVAR